MKKLFLFIILLLLTLGFTNNASAIYVVPGDQSVTTDDISTAEKAIAGLQWDVSRAVYDNKVKLYLPKFDGYSWTVRKDMGDYIGIGLYWEQVYDGEGNVTLEMNITNPKGVGYYVLFSNNSTATVIAEENYIFYPSSGVNYIPPENRITVSTDENGNITGFYDVNNNTLDSNDPKVVDNLKNNPINISNSSSGSSSGSSSNNANSTNNINLNSIKFSDFSTSHWGYKVIYDLTSLGYIKGYPDGTFRPDGNITRAEFSAIMSVLIKDKWPDGARYDNGEIFPDMKSSHWAFGATKQLTKYMTKDETLQVFGDNFLPNQKITRDEVVATIHNILKRHDKFVSNSEEKPAFVDLKKSKFIDSVTFSVNKGFINGYPDGTFRPNGNITRAEIAAILIKVANALN